MLWPYLLLLITRFGVGDDSPSPNLNGPALNLLSELHQRRARRRERSNKYSEKAGLREDGLNAADERAADASEARVPHFITSTNPLSPGSEFLGDGVLAEPGADTHAAHATHAAADPTELAALRASRRAKIMVMAP